MTKGQWQRQDRARFKRERGYSRSAHYGTGGLRERVLERDGRRCVKCGMSDAAHKKRWDRPITVDHRDRNRRHNTMENLHTLCLICHGRKDLLPRLRTSKVAHFKQRILALREKGLSCNRIAQKIGVGCRVITKWLRRWQNGRL